LSHNSKDTGGLVFLVSGSYYKVLLLSTAVSTIFNYIVPARSLGKTPQFRNIFPHFRKLRKIDKLPEFRI
jgi:hypothetical protein